MKFIYATRKKQTKTIVSRIFRVNLHDFINCVNAQIISYNLKYKALNENMY